MKLRYAALALGTMLFAAPSFAADTVRPLVPVAAPIVVSNPFEGFYLGGNVGYGWANRKGCSDIFSGGDSDCNPNDPSSGSGEGFNYDQNGWLVGGQAGINHVVGGPHGLVIGAEVSADLSGLTGKLTDQYPGYNGNGDWNWLALGMAKIGITHGNWMLYGQGGVALGSFTYNAAACNFSANNQGWAYGAGVAVAMASNNNMFVDWTHIQFDNKQSNCGDPVDPPITFDTTIVAKPTADILRVGFNHAFN